MPRKPSALAGSQWQTLDSNYFTQRKQPFDVSIEVPIWG